MPLSFEIDAQTLPEAVEEFACAIRISLGAMLRKLDELRREQASSLIVPGQSGLDIGSLGKPR